MHDVVSAIAEQTGRGPDRIALRVAEREHTYAELWRAAGSVAARLGPRPGRVGLVFRREFPTYAAYLGILRAGGAVLPIGPRWPQKRIREVLDHAAPATVLVDGEVPDPATFEGVRLVSAADHLDGTGPAPAGVEAEPGQEAYVLHTSGSTGRPKGVPVDHRALRAYLTHVIDRYELGPGCRMAQAADLTFDGSVFEILAAWASGAGLVAAAGHSWRSPARFLAEHAITHLDTVPSVIAIARRMRTLGPGALPDLRWSMFGGEQLTYEAAAAWRAAAPGSVVENIYGPTELAGVCVSYRMPDDPTLWPDTGNGTVPIGTVYPHLEETVLDPAGLPADDGELCVRGPQRFAGYVDPADDRGRFLRGPAPHAPVVGRPAPEDWYRTGDRVRRQDGLLVHWGRVDRQVKLRGHRVELDEVEAAVRGRAGVREAAVVVVDSQLVATYTTDTADGVTGGDLRAHVAALLPDYMVPVVWRQMDELPLTQNGKLDRALLERA
ncbi:AMP-binding protein [Streptomyces sp. NBC_01335]|uniref:AMP-binding protein n=1 Tax=Streptomyces sp. NBC_01335 TaxID=2903828 RepID=UPI002E0F9521|nr:AMP-binding protein [Streptomyces sp. NBC_01335]